MVSDVFTVITDLTIGASLATILFVVSLCLRLIMIIPM